MASTPTHTMRTATSRRLDGGATASYVYDALNNRVHTVTSAGTTDFVFNANGQRVSVWNGSTRAQLRGQYYWGSKPVAFYDTSATHFQHQGWVALGTNSHLWYIFQGAGGIFSLA